jgi:hypothetical protein
MRGCPQHVPHQRRALALAGDLGHGAAHVEVHDVAPERLHPLGSPREDVDVLAEELHREGAFRGVVGGDGIGVRVIHEERGRVHLLRRREAAAALAGDQTEGRVGGPGHARRARVDLDGADLHGISIAMGGPSRARRSCASLNRSSPEG